MYTCRHLELSSPSTRPSAYPCISLLNPYAREDGGNKSFGLPDLRAMICRFHGHSGHRVKIREGRSHNSCCSGVVSWICSCAQGSGELVSVQDSYTAPRSSITGTTRL
ncbi:hypothetical protein EJ110_NYTH26312 [Nymphaea thermarum]|nr:hypothetical protein EJ110_NYTH26312 [Nymphaea thermarum]